MIMPYFIDSCLGFVRCTFGKMGFYPSKPEGDPNNIRTTPVSFDTERGF